MGLQRPGQRVPATSRGEPTIDERSSPKRIHPPHGFVNEPCFRRSRSPQWVTLSRIVERELELTLAPKSTITLCGAYDLMGTGDFVIYMFASLRR